MAAALQDETARSGADQGGHPPSQPDRRVAGRVHRGGGAAQAGGPLQVLPPVAGPQEAHRVSLLLAAAQDLSAESPQEAQAARATIHTRTTTYD